ncbi:hypothetical protein E2C01_015313 [Portunus trituberculatus]|uniref:Uncharacterized protein n=1 Tax=Portunus trituberculatus TaxID=210409 RepID=A0A5B7DL14_PORTR|nr:hypothetical protein [Portunus trituberculatus]
MRSGKRCLLWRVVKWRAGGRRGGTGDPHPLQLLKNTSFITWQIVSLAFENSRTEGTAHFRIFTSHRAWNLSGLVKSIPGCSGLHAGVSVRKRRPGWLCGARLELHNSQETLL